MSKRDSKTRLPAAQRRQQILDATLPVFAQMGYAGAGTRDLAAAADISEPILYRHFGDKAGLFEAVVRLAGARLEAAATASAEGAESVADRIERLARALPELLVTHRDALRVVSAGAMVGDGDRVQAAVAQTLTSLGTTLADLMPSSGLREGLPRETAGFFLLQIGLGASHLHHLGIEAIDDEHYSPRIIALLRDGIAAAP